MGVVPAPRCSKHFPLTSGTGSGLPTTGGQMSGDIDLNNNRLVDAVIDGSTVTFEDIQEAQAALELSTAYQGVPLGNRFGAVHDYWPRSMLGP